MDNLPTIGPQSTKNSAAGKNSSDTPLIKLMQVEQKNEDKSEVTPIEEEVKGVTTQSDEGDGLDTDSSANNRAATSKETGSVAEIFKQRLVN